MMIKEPLENDIPRHQKRRGKRDRPFVIEYRYIGPSTTGVALVDRYLEERREWSRYDRFETRRQAEQSLASLQSSGNSWKRRFEYRLVEPVA